MKNRISSCIIVTATLIIAGPSISNAQEHEPTEIPTGAKESFDRGVKLFNENDYTGALAEFLAAYKVKPHFNVLYNIAQCYAMLDQHAKALEYYKDYMAQGMDYMPEERKEAVEDEIERLQGLLCPLTLEVVPEGATVLLDGKNIGQAPIAEIFYLDPGEHTLTVQKGGFESQAEEFIMRRDEEKTLKVELEALPEPVIEDPVPVMEEPDPVVEEPVPEPDEPEPAKKPLHPAAFWSALGLTGALGIVAAVTGGLALKKGDEFANTCVDHEDRWTSLRDQGEKLALATDVLIGVTSAAAVVTVVLGILTFKKTPESSSTALAPFVSDEAVGVLIGGAF